MKKFVSLVAVLLLVASCLAACSINPQETVAPTVQETVAPPKDADYLYDWLTQHGTLVGGTCLQYSGTDEIGIKFTLCYDTGYVDDLRWRVEYSTKDGFGRTCITKLYLFSDGDKYLSQISVCGFGAFDDYYRTLEYYHDPVKFTHNSPVDFGDSSGKTVNIDTAEKDLIREVMTISDICEDRAQKNLCLILDWLKDSFCPTADMTMPDFGYDNY